MWIEATTIADLLDSAAAETDRTAIVFPECRLSYKELAALSERFARSLRALGVGPGEKVGILMPNCIDFVGGLFGAAKLGAIVVPINGRFKTHELGHVVSHADVRTLLTCAGPEGTVDYPTLLGSAFPEVAEQDGESLTVTAAPALRQIVDLGRRPVAHRPGFVGRAAFEAAEETVDPEEVKTLQARVRVRDIALLMYTSGTTAKPKGCLLTHESVVRHGRNVALSRFGLTAADCFWDPLPLFHIGGIVPMLGCFAVRARYCHAGHFDPDVALRMLAEERVTVAYPAFETIWLQVLNHPHYADADLSAIRMIQNIAVPERLIRMQEAMPQAVEVSSFGATECSSNLTMPLASDSFEARMYTLGHPVPGMELKIIDPETGQERPPGVVGELLFRGYARFEGYYKDEELTRTTIDPEGWFHSGDLGKVDEAGRFVYTGRLKDMLKVGGENVSALEVEDFLATHPAVDIVQVVSAPDARYTEVPAAFVQLKPGATLDERELIAYCVGRIATFKVPRYVRVVDEWPMSGTKIQKFVLREMIADDLRSLGITEAPRIESAPPQPATR